MNNISKFRKIVYEALKENNIDPEELFFEHAKHLDYAEDKITDLGENICDHLLECLRSSRDVLLQNLGACTGAQNKNSGGSVKDTCKAKPGYLTTHGKFRLVLLHS